MTRNPLPRLGAAVRRLREKHRARHEPTGFDIAIADRIALLDGDRWDAAAASGGFHLQRAYLAVVEAHGPDTIEPAYALVARDDQPIAAIAAQWLHFAGERIGKKNGEPDATSKRRRLLQPIARKALDGLRQRVLVCGNLLSWGNHGVAFAKGVDPAAAWPAVGEALYRLRRAGKLDGETDFVAVKDITPAEAAHFPSLELLGYRRVATEPNMVLDVHASWRGLDDYFGALAAKYRKAGKRIRDDVAAAGCVVAPLRDHAEFAAAAPRLQQLWDSVHQNAPIRLATLDAGFWPAFAACAGDRLQCTTIRNGETIVGFVNTLRDGGTAIGYQIGFDRQAAATAPIYLRLLQATIESAIGFGCRRLSLGRTALEPKARLGARPEPVEVWLRHRIPALNLLLKGFVGHVHHDEAPDRNPFA